MYQATTIEEIQQFVRDQAGVRATGSGSKPALSRNANLKLTELSGILEYQPSEYTFTALAGTPIREVQQQLAKNGQYLPFDPPFIEAGATLGGTVASGLSGPGRFRYGGVRDFLLGVRLVNGLGDVVYGGGKVVKNAAGFDIPKLMIGALGQFGVLVEFTFKVFPSREASETIVAELADTVEAIEAMNNLAASNSEIDHLDLEPPGKLWIRISGMGGALPGRIERLKSLLPSAAVVQRADDSIWSNVREFHWVRPEHGLVKVPLAPMDIVKLDAAVTAMEPAADRRYSVGGNVAWLSWPNHRPVEDLGAILGEIGRPALAVIGDWPQVLFGSGGGGVFADRLQATFDPGGKFNLANALSV